MRQLAIVLVGVLCAAWLTACGGSESTGTAAGPTSSASQPATSTASPQKPPGDPAPAQLQGDWLSIETSGLSPVRLTIRESSYRASRVGEAGGSGEIVVRGDEIDFFNSGLCGLYLPEGVGRYRWRIKGNKLQLHVIEKDPCGGRAAGIDATFKRAG
jgi:hypothetical protein